MYIFIWFLNIFAAQLTSVFDTISFQISGSWSDIFMRLG